MPWLGAGVAATGCDGGVDCGCAADGKDGGDGLVNMITSGFAGSAGLAGCTCSKNRSFEAAGFA